MYCGITLYPLNVDQYISRDYNNLDDEKKYTRIKDAFANMGTRVVEIIRLQLGEFHMDVMFVGMRFRGHTFQPSDNVVKFDAYAVKVLEE